MSGIDISLSMQKKNSGVRKAARLSTKVDMTPMVDLGFLLITFFIFTATVSEPKAMDLNMPAIPKNDSMKISLSGALTVMPVSDNRVYYYEGMLEDGASNFKQTTFAGIRDVIIQKKKQVMAAYIPNVICEQKANGSISELTDCRQEKLFVTIKMGEQSSYKNVVDILDEMTINQVKRYALVKISDTESELIKLSGAK
jgi:biopolymer transport protein ExbD